MSTPSVSEQKLDQLIQQMARIEQSIAQLQQKIARMEELLAAHHSNMWDGFNEIKRMISNMS